jgi:hypothetical protein
MQRAIKDNWAALDADSDPEMKYYQASIFAYCGETKMALQLLRNAIAHNYCAVTALKNDPVWKKCATRKILLKYVPKPLIVRESFSPGGGAVQGLEAGTGVASNPISSSSQRRG